MIKVITIVCLIGTSVAQTQYVWDLLKPALNAAEVQAILANKDAGQFPTYDTIPQTSFNCASKKQPGFYADTEAQCQVFHRCDINGNQTSYMCVNSTLFNQVTLVCDYFFNVDCARFAGYEDFANSRLYTDQPLFDTPPDSYVPPGVGAAQILTAKPVVPAVPKPAPKPAAKPKPVAPVVPAKPQPAAVAPKLSARYTNVAPEPRLALPSFPVPAKSGSKPLGRADTAGKVTAGVVKSRFTNAQSEPRLIMPRPFIPSADNRAGKVLSGKGKALPRKSARKLRFDKL
ncbi:uncharacterized protein LOC129596231 [Paramacrobiotus metropolitanus]|uniref:uncharacterized protein LOC129596231 n=1 Tax=Paramacrobiotus metropolitanus TaxID=2943436 RepID=UPI002445AE14|nr:uncharacterized protein LOC129596231 [Paramacrobiotus metropolitanus]